MIEDLGAEFTGIDLWLLVVLCAAATTIATVTFRMSTVVVSTLAFAALSQSSWIYGYRQGLFLGGIAAVVIAANAASAFVHAYFPGAVSPVDTTALDGIPIAADSEPSSRLPGVLAAGTAGTFVAIIVSLLGTGAFVWLWNNVLGAVELTVGALLLLLMISILNRGAMVKGVIAGLVGLLAGNIGFSDVAASVLVDFGIDALWDGIPPITGALALIGLPSAARLIYGPVVSDVADSPGFSAVTNWRFRAMREWPTGLRQALFVALVPLFGLSGLSIPTQRWLEFLPHDEPAIVIVAFIFAVAWVVAVATGLGLARVLGPLARVPQQVLGGVIVVLILGLSDLSWGSLSIVPLVIILGLLGGAMQTAGWPRVPLVMGFWIGPMLVKWYSLASATYGIGGFASRTSSLVLVLASIGIIAAVVIRGRRHGQDAPPSRGTLRIAAIAQAEAIVTVVMASLPLGFLVASARLSGSRFADLAALLAFWSTGALVLMAVQFTIRYRSSNLSLAELARVDMPPIVAKAAIAIGAGFLGLWVLAIFLGLPWAAVTVGSAVVGWSLRGNRPWLWAPATGLLSAGILFFLFGPSLFLGN